MESSSICQYSIRRRKKKFDRTSIDNTSKTIDTSFASNISISDPELLDLAKYTDTYPYKNSTRTFTNIHECLTPLACNSRFGEQVSGLCLEFESGIMYNVATSSSPVDGSEMRACVKTFSPEQECLDNPTEIYIDPAKTQLPQYKKFLTNILRLYNSNALKEDGFVNALTDVPYFVGARNGKIIDPLVLLAFFGNESTFGTAGRAVRNKAIGNIRYPSLAENQAFCTGGIDCGLGIDGEPLKCESLNSPDDGNGKYCKYASWKGGIEHWYHLIGESGLYVQNNPEDPFNPLGDTIEEIYPIYAPASDNNPTNLAIDSAKRWTCHWRELVKVYNQEIQEFA